MVDSAYLTEIGERVAAHGITALRHVERAELLRAGSRAGVSPTMLGLLADPSAPEAPRVRALSRVLVALDRGARTPAPVAAGYVLVPPTPDTGRFVR